MSGRREALKMEKKKCQGNPRERKSNKNDRSLEMLVLANLKAHGLSMKEWANLSRNKQS